MTFEDDVLELRFDGGTKHVFCKNLNISWPPPETITVWGFRMRRESMSKITDRQRAEMTHVVRGAVYVPDIPEKVEVH